jgi:hypothetical protein
MDEDPGETGDWLTSLGSLLRNTGAERVRYILSALDQRAKELGVLYAQAMSRTQESRRPAHPPTYYLDMEPACHPACGNRSGRSLSIASNWEHRGRYVRSNKMAAGYDSQSVAYPFHE